MISGLSSLIRRRKKNVFALSIPFFLVFILTSRQAAAQSCNSGCNVTVNVGSSPGATLKATSHGQTICLTGSGTYTGTIDFNNRSNVTLCVGSSVTVSSSASYTNANQSWTINNYGTFNEPLTLGTSQRLNNYGQVNGSITMNGSATISNSGTFKPSAFTFNNSNSFTNESSGTAEIPGFNVNSGSTFVNYGSLKINGNLQNNSNGNVLLGGSTTITGNLGNNGTLKITGTPSIGGDITNNGSGTITGEGSTTCNMLCPGTGKTLTNGGTLNSISICRAATNNTNSNATVVGAAPTTQPTNLILTVSGSSISGRFTAASGSPAGYVVMRRRGAQVPTADYPSSSLVYSVGDEIGSSKVIDIISGLTFTDDLESDDCGEYYYAVFSTSSVSSNCRNTNTASPLTGGPASFRKLNTTFTGTILYRSCTMNVSFDAPCSFNANNTFQVQLSDQNGTFGTSPTVIGTQAGTGPVSIPVTIPSALTIGTAYRVRVVSSSPAVIGVDNGQNLTAQALPTMTNMPANSTVCANATVSATNFGSNPSSASTTFSWSNNNPAIGLAASGTGQVPAFTATNSTTANIVATITVRASQGGCPGPTSSYTITVRPTPVITSSLTADVCSGSVFNYTITSQFANATFAWSRAAVTGISTTAPASGSGASISQTLTNTTTSPIKVTYVLTPSSTSTLCAGLPSSLVVIVAPSGTIATWPIGSSTLCVGSSFPVSFSAPCGFGTDNEFVAQLSSATGSFTNPIVIGTLSSSTSGTIQATIPSGIVSGGIQYRIRIVGSQPVSTVHLDNGTDLTVQVSSISPMAPQSFTTNEVGNLLTAPTEGVTSWQWGYYKVLGGAITYLSEKTSGTYQPQGSDFSTPGTYYIICEMTTSSAGCGTSISNPVTVYINCPLSTNLIVNGDFSQGNTGFTSQYTFVASGGSMIPEGTYAVGNNPYSYHGSFCDMNDETKRSKQGTSSNSGGNMLIGNAATTGSRNLWQQTITVKQNTDYVLTFWAVSLAGATNSLQFGIYAGCFRTGADISVVQAGVDNCTWTKFTVQMSSGNMTSVNMAIRNISAAAGGNDIAIDDIMMYECSGGGNFAVANSYIWRGFSSNWFDMDNWGTSCSLPSCSDDITIPVLTPDKVAPIINATGASVGSVTIEKNASLTINAGFNLNVCGDFNNSGSLLNSSTSSVTFIGNKTPQVLSGSLTGTNRLGQLIVNKTNASNVMQLSSPVETIDNITITNGRLNANGQVIRAGKNFTISANGTYISGNNTLRIAGDMSNAGVFTANSGLVEFNGTANQQFSQTGSGAFYNLGINNGTPTNTVTFNPSVTTVTNQLILTRGIAVTDISSATASSQKEISVTNSAANAVTGYSASSFVNGKLRRSVSGLNTYEYPVGAVASGQARYNLIRMTVTSNLGVSSVAGYFKTTSYASATPTRINNVDYTVCSGGFWDLTPNTSTLASGARYSLSIFPDAAFTCLGTRTFLKRPNSTQPWSFDGSTWQDENTRTGVQSFSEYVVASAGNVSLPVALLNFTGRLKEEQVHLNWVTASEKNNDFFEIQRSLDARRFEAIGKVKGAGTTQERLAYSFVDEAPQSGISYYRLMQVDFNGQVSYSPVLAIHNSDVVDAARLFPNPIGAGEEAHLQIKTAQARTYWLQILNMQGRELSSYSYQAQPGINSFAIPETAVLKPGVYIMQLNASGEGEGQKAYQFKLLIR